MCSYTPSSIGSPGSRQGFKRRRLLGSNVKNIQNVHVNVDGLIKHQGEVKGKREEEKKKGMCVCIIFFSTAKHELKMCWGCFLNTLIDKHF